MRTPSPPPKRFQYVMPVLEALVLEHPSRSVIALPMPSAAAPSRNVRRDIRPARTISVHSARRLRCSVAICDPPQVDWRQYYKTDYENDINGAIISRDGACPHPARELCDGQADGGKPHPYY